MKKEQDHIFKASRLVLQRCNSIMGSEIIGSPVQITLLELHFSERWTNI